MREKGDALLGPNGPKYLFIFQTCERKGGHPLSIQMGPNIYIIPEPVREKGDALFDPLSPKYISPGPVREKGDALFDQNGTPIFI